MLELDHYIRGFKKLRVDSASAKKHGGTAPHKPILLLSVIDAIEAGEITSRYIFITPELVARFKSNWSLLVTTTHNENFVMPFFHLKNDKGNFWHLHPNSGYEKVLYGKISSFKLLTDSIAYALIDQELFLLLSTDEGRIKLRLVLLDFYFPETKISYINKNISENHYLKLIEDKITTNTPEEYVNEYDVLDEEEVFVRSRTFQRLVPQLYDYTCCVSGLKIVAVLDIQLIDACHIVPFNKSHNDTISNGIALSPNFHRAFDRGLFTIDQDYRIIVSNLFTETGNVVCGLKQFHKKQILLPENKSFYPRVSNFDWHQKNIFKS